MELGLVPGWDWASLKIRWAKRCNFSDQILSQKPPKVEDWKQEPKVTTCLADKTNHPVKRLSLNRSQCGSCSTKYDTSAGT